MFLTLFSNINKNSLNISHLQLFHTPPEHDVWNGTLVESTRKKSVCIIVRWYDKQISLLPGFLGPLQFSQL
eukprot:UN01300